MEVRISTYQLRSRSILFVFGNLLTYTPAEAEVDVGLGPERTRPGRHRRQDTAATSNSVIPIATMGQTGFHFAAAELVISTILVPKVLTALSSPVQTLSLFVFSPFV